MAGSRLRHPQGVAAVGESRPGLEPAMSPRWVPVWVPEGWFLGPGIRNLLSDQAGWTLPGGTFLLSKNIGGLTNEYPRLINFFSAFCLRFSKSFASFGMKYSIPSGITNFLFFIIVGT